MRGDLKPVSLRFPRGVDQVSPETALPEGAARRLVNVDIHNGSVGKYGTSGGRMTRRNAITRVVQGVMTQSLWSCKAATLYIDGTNLMALSADMAASVLRADVGNAEMHYVEVNGCVYYSNGTLTGTVRNGQDGAWGLPVPAASVTSAVGFGGLAAGTYMVALTYRDADGRESGASPTEVVRVDEGGGIALSGIDTSAYAARVYVSPANGEALYWAHDVPVGNTASYVGAHSPGKLLATQHMVAPEPCTLLEHYNGRIYGVVGTALVATQAMNYDLTRPATDYVLFADVPTMNKAVVDGLYIGSASGVVFLGGAELSQFAKRTVDPLPPIPGSAMRVDGALFGAAGDGVVWLTRRGWVFGGPTGQVKRLTDGQMALPDYARAAGLYREHNGLRQLLTFVQGGGEAAGASDSYETEIVRNGRVVN